MNFFRISTLWVPDHHLNMEWDHPERPALKEWSIKAFDGNLLLASLGFLLPTLGVFFFMWLIEGDIWLGLIPSAFVGYITYNASVQKRMCVYRLTEKGGEVHDWRAIPNFIFASMPWLAGIYLILVLWGFSFSPEVGLGALVGGGGMGLLYALVFTSEDYKKNQLDLSHWKFEWREIYEVIYDRKGHAIGFTTEDSKPYIVRFKEDNENFYGCRIYFHPKMAEELLRLFKSKIDPSIKIKEGRIHYRTVD